MKPLTVNELRESFVNFFEKQGHRRIPSASLVPHGDPTLLFTTAGMVQFKPYFMGAENPPGQRMTSVQKCFRTTDVESVGDQSHLTFFEMLGNFSIGEYFKADAIKWAWEFLTGVLDLPTSRLWATVYIDDDEAFDLWREIGLPADRILRYNADQGNFWGPPGESGPCGPCSELHYDFGPITNCEMCAEERCHPDIECGRFLEIWNLVFMALHQDESGNHEPLPAQNVDTGAGLERLAWVLQDVNSVYETDELRKLLGAVEEVTGHSYDPVGAPQISQAMRVICDHSRAVAFLVADGVLPANDGRGYVLRRILRRAVYFGYTIGLNEPFIQRVVEAAIDSSNAWYPDVANQHEFIGRVATLEESRFQAALARGIEFLEILLERESESRLLPGQDIFTLYDTHGLPPELSLEIAISRGYRIDQEGFDTEMQEQRLRSRSEISFDISGEERSQRYAALGFETEFKGHESVVTRSEIISIVADERSVERLESGLTGELLLAATSFYPEGGGQVGDQGDVITSTGRFRVDNTLQYGNAIVHFGEVTEGVITIAELAEAHVNSNFRDGSARNHTATHLLHAALRTELGSHVRQAGSYVGPDRLRFDYTHPEAPDLYQLRAIQRLVNEKIRDDIPRETLELPYEEAIDRGAIAFFEDRYTTNVRMVQYCHPDSHEGTSSDHSVDCFSRELCGGTHLHSTGQVGSLQIVNDTSIGSGLRRIEAVTGVIAEEFVEKRLSALRGLSQHFRVPDEEVSERVMALEEQLVEERKLRATLEGQASSDVADELTSEAEEVDGTNILVARIEVESSDALRPLADRLREKLGSSLIVLGAGVDERPVLLAAATSDIVDRGVAADDIIRSLAEIIDGGGGGRKDLAQAGGRDLSNLDEALEVAKKIAKAQVQNDQ